MFIKSDSKLINLEEVYGVERTFNTVYIEGKGTGIASRKKQSITFRTEGIAEAFVLDVQNYLNAKTATEKSETGKLVAKYSERLNEDLESDLNLEEFLNSRSFLEQRVNFYGLNHGIDIQSVKKSVVDFLETRMGYFFDKTNSHQEEWIINRLAETMDIDNRLLQNVIDYMQRKNEVKLFCDSFDIGEYTMAIVLTGSVENYKTRLKNEKNKPWLWTCGCVLIIAFCLFLILLTIL